MNCKLCGQVCHLRELPPDGTGLPDQAAIYFKPPAKSLTNTGYVCVCAGCSREINNEASRFARKKVAE